MKSFLNHNTPKFDDDNSAYSASRFSKKSNFFDDKYLTLTSSF